MNARTAKLLARYASLRTMSDAQEAQQLKRLKAGWHRLSPAGRGVVRRELQHQLLLYDHWAHKQRKTNRG